MNKGITCFGIEQVMLNMEAFVSSYKDIPLVSVGSGNGLLENEINSKCNVNIICVDPDPSSYSKPPIVIQPHYNYVKDLINAKPIIVNNCLLLLNWCNPNMSEYDYEAIKLLKPVAFIAIYEEHYHSYGAAGGIKFYEYIHNNDEYNLVHSTKGYEDPLMPINYSVLLIEWYQKKELITPNTEKLYSKVKLINIFDDNSDCLIM